MSVQAGSSDSSANFSAALSDEPYGGYGDADVYASNSGKGTVALPTVTGDRSHYYFVTITGAEVGSGTGVQLPYTVTITTSSGEPQPDLVLRTGA